MNTQSITQTTTKDVNLIIDKCYKQLKDIERFSFSPHFKYTEIELVLNTIKEIPKSEYFISLYQNEVDLLLEALIITNKHIIFKNTDKDAQIIKLNEVNTIDYVSEGSENYIIVNDERVLNLNVNLRVTKIYGEFLKEIITINLPEIDFSNFEEKTFFKVEEIHINPVLVNKWINEKDEKEKKIAFNNLIEHASKITFKDSFELLEKIIINRRIEKDLNQIWEFYDENENLFFTSDKINIIKGKLINGEIKSTHLCKRNHIGSFKTVKDFLAKEEKKIKYLYEPIKKYRKTSLILGIIAGIIMATFYLINSDIPAGISIKTEAAVLLFGIGSLLFGILANNGMGYWFGAILSIVGIIMLFIKLSTIIAIVLLVVALTIATSYLIGLGLYYLKKPVKLI
ncbi:hypothetical protein ACFLSE_00670 [Bacteroidota bacterium]